METYELDSCIKHTTQVDNNEKYATDQFVDCVV